MYKSKGNIYTWIQKSIWINPESTPILSIIVSLAPTVEPVI